MSGSRVRVPASIVAGFLLAGYCSGQVPGASAITGVVRDSATGRPLENVNVFLSSTTIGTGTDRDGRYELKSLRPGRYDIVFSRVDYKFQAIPIDLSVPGSFVRDMVLSPRSIVLGDVEVSAEANRAWKRNYESFRQIFLGEGPNAAECVIKNPEVLNFNLDPYTRTLKAGAGELLMIANSSLGYTMQVSLSDFRWDTRSNYGHFIVHLLFKPMSSTTVADFATWEANRRRTYNGSLQHFLRSIAARNPDSNGFILHKGSLDDLQEGRGQYLPPEELDVQPVLGTPFKRWAYDGWLRIDRQGGTKDDVSFIELEDSTTLIDPEGILVNPLSINLGGRWAKDRVADMLPRDYVVKEASGVRRQGTGQ